MRLRRFLNANHFVRVYDLQNSERSGIYMALFNERPEWNGIASGATHRIADDAGRKSVHVFDALRAQLAVAGIAGVTHDDLGWIEADVAAFKLPASYMLVAAGCSRGHPKKRWPAENYAEICRWLLGQGITPVLLGTNDDIDVNEQIVAQAPGVIDLTNQTSLRQIAVLARGARVAVGNDTGPIQMIGPTGCKTLALFPGFSNPKRHGPLGANVKTIQKDAMADIGVDEVKNALQPMLAA
jgi:ADP-heptose:LPS heptosyltransferase